MATPNQNTDRNSTTSRKPQDSKVGTRNSQSDTDFDTQKMDQGGRQSEEQHQGQSDRQRTGASRGADMPSTSDDVSSSARSAGSVKTSRDEVSASPNQQAKWDSSSSKSETDDINVYGQDSELDQDDDYQSDTRNESDSLRKPIAEKFPGAAQDPKKMSANSLDIDSDESEDFESDLNSSRSSGRNSTPKAPSKKDDFSH